MVVRHVAANALRAGGATTGMAYGTGLIRNRALATALIAVFVLIGATFDSSHVVSTVGTGIIHDADLTPLGAMVMMLTAALVTAANGRYRVLCSLHASIMAAARTLNPARLCPAVGDPVNLRGKCPAE